MPQGAHTGYSNEKMVRNDQKLDEIRLSRVQSRAGRCEIDEGVGAGGRKRAHPPPPLHSPPTRPHLLADFAPLARGQWGRDNLIEFSTVSDHFFVRISSVGSLWLCFNSWIPAPLHLNVGQSIYICSFMHISVFCHAINLYLLNETEVCR